MNGKNSFFEECKAELLSKYEDEIAFFSKNNYNLNLKFRNNKDESSYYDILISKSWESHFPLLGAIIEIFKSIWRKVSGSSNRTLKITKAEQLWLVAEIYPLNLNRNKAMHARQWISFCGCVAEVKTSSKRKVMQRKKKDFWFEEWIKRKKRLTSKLSVEEFYKKHKNDFLIRTFFYHRYKLLFNKSIRKGYPVISLILVVLFLALFLYLDISLAVDLYERFGMQV